MKFFSHWQNIYFNLYLKKKKKSFVVYIKSRKCIKQYLCPFQNIFLSHFLHWIVLYNFFRLLKFEYVHTNIFISSYISTKILYSFSCISRSSMILSIEHFAFLRVLICSHLVVRKKKKIIVIFVRDPYICSEQ